MNRGYLRLLFAGLAVLLMAVPAAHAAGDEAMARQEAGALQLESLLEELLGAGDQAPVYTDHGDGFHSISLKLEPEVKERLLAATRSGNAEDKATTFYFLAAGQQLTPPTNPATCIHAALSNTNLPYNYWVVVLNLGTQNLTRTTTVKLTGPGRKFNKSLSANFGADGIWALWYNPSVGVGNPGVYTYQATVAGAGSFVIRSFAVRP